jgi:hypothetical protein
VSKMPAYGNHLRASNIFRLDSSWKGVLQSGHRVFKMRSMGLHVRYLIGLDIHLLFRLDSSWKGVLQSGHRVFKMRSMGLHVRYLIGLDIHLILFRLDSSWKGVLQSGHPFFQNALYRTSRKLFHWP